MKHFMFDIDGTLVDSFGFDERCYVDAVKEVLDVEMQMDWHTYPHITDSGILMEVQQRYDINMPYEALLALVKPAFSRRVKNYLLDYGIEPIAGAVEFLSKLRTQSDTLVSLATGGWFETAKLKLDTAGFNTDGIVLASASDHHTRIEIMRSAERRASLQAGSLVVNTPIYFGDAEWDKKACAELGWEFVLVGDRTDHERWIRDFRHHRLLEGLT